MVRTQTVRAVATSEQSVGNGGASFTTSSDLELVSDMGVEQVVAVRFDGLAIPAGSTIVDATVQFTCDEPTRGYLSLVFMRGSWRGALRLRTVAV